jgi:hypothetical protein
MEEAIRDAMVEIAPAPSVSMATLEKVRAILGDMSAEELLYFRDSRKRKFGELLAHAAAFESYDIVRPADRDGAMIVIQ